MVESSMETLLKIVFDLQMQLLAFEKLSQTRLKNIIFLIAIFNQ